MSAEPAELITKVQEHPRSQAMRPVNIAVEAEQIRGISESEEIRHIRARALECEASVNLILHIDGLVEARLQGILVRRARQRNLIVIALASIEIRQGIKLQQRFSLRTDPACRDHAIGKGLPCCRIDNRIFRLRKIAATFPAAVGTNPGSVETVRFRVH